MSRATFESEEARIRTAYANRGAAIEEKYSWFNRAHLLSVQERERQMLDVLRRRGLSALSSLRVVEFGCGRGSWLREFIKWGVRPENITGLDLLHDRLEEARRLCPPGVHLIQGNAATAVLEPHGYDIVLQSMMLTSMLDTDVRAAAAAAMRASLRPGGVILSYDYHVNNPRNPDVRRLTRRDLAQLFPDCRIEVRRVTLAAPLARPLAAHAPAFHALLAAVPWLRSHYLAAITPRELA